MCSSGKIKCPVVKLPPMHELLPNQFAPVNEAGANPIFSGHGEIILWEYKPSGPPDFLSRDFVVAKTPGMGDQYILGPEPAVRQVAKAFNILDALGYERLRTMSVIINPYIYGGKINKAGTHFIDDLFKRFGIADKTRGTQINHLHNGNRVNVLGIDFDVRNPIAIFGDIQNYPNYWTEAPDDISTTLLYVGFLRHEWAHVEQGRYGLLTNSLEAERHALSEEARLLTKFLNADQLLSKKQKDFLAKRIRLRVNRIYNYRNGITDADHKTDNAYFRHVWHKSQSLHNQDFVFGE